MHPLQQFNAAAAEARHSAENKPPSEPMFGAF
jgi:hypothetical protein